MRRVRERLEDIGADGEGLAGALRELVHGVREWIGFRAMRAALPLFPAYSRAIMLDAYYHGARECARAFAAMHGPFGPDRCPHGRRIVVAIDPGAGSPSAVVLNPCQRCAEESLRGGPGPFGPRCLHGVELSQQPTCCVVTDELRAKMSAIVADELAKEGAK